MYYKNIRGNCKIVNYYKLLKYYTHLYVPIPWFGYLPLIN